MPVTELQTIIWFVGTALVVNIFAVILHFLYMALSDSPLRDFIRSVIFELDRFADNMENSEKRRAAIQQINELLGWRKILIPSVLTGWIINAEVAAIRRMQSSSNAPDLHAEDEHDV